MLVHHPGTDTSPLGPCGGKEERTASVRVPLMIGTVVSHASAGNPVYNAQVGGNGNTAKSSEVSPTPG